MIAAAIVAERLWALRLSKVLPPDLLQRVWQIVESRQINDKVYAKVEYRYSNYENARLEYPDGATTGRFGIDTDRHQVVAGVGMRF